MGWGRARFVERFAVPRFAQFSTKDVREGFFALFDHIGHALAQYRAFLQRLRRPIRLRARGGFEVALAWNEGELTAATITSARGGECVVRYGDEVARFVTKARGRYVMKPGELAFEVE